jgi:hypothetical protein
MLCLAGCDCVLALVVDRHSEQSSSCYMLAFCLAFSALKIEAGFSSETSFDFQQLYSIKSHKVKVIIFDSLLACLMDAVDSFQIKPNSPTQLN